MSPCDWQPCGKKAGLSQKELARKLRTPQQQISRLESTAYEGHSSSLLRRVAKALGATVHRSLVPGHLDRSKRVAESKTVYHADKKP